MKGIVAVILACGGIAHAQSDNLQSQKDRMLQHMDQRAANMNKMRSCVQAAQDQAALDKCRDDMKAMHKEMKHDRMEMRKEHLEQKKAQLDQQKARLDEATKKLDSQLKR